ncbi:MAG: hypothetical protein KA352_07495 [Flavobacteriales bacterium]|nr:hypothetical protein [Flavobacteriales bacterium]
MNYRIFSCGLARTRFWNGLPLAHANKVERELDADVAQEQALAYQIIRAEPFRIGVGSVYKRFLVVETAVGIRVEFTRCVAQDVPM